jgi:uncharacterized membrane protein (UPF0182 family)
MSERRTSIMPEDFDGQIIDIDTKGATKRRRRGRWLFALGLLALLFALSRASSIYIETLWFGSLGYAAVYWTTFKYEVALFAAFALATIVILRGAFWLLERAFDVSALAPRRILLNNQPVFVQPARLLKPVAWLVSIFFGFVYGAGVSGEWERFALWLNRPRTNEVDPIFGRQVGFYLFTLPVAETLASWLLTLAFVTTVGALAYALLSLIPAGADVEDARAKATTLPGAARRSAYAAVSTALALLLTALALRVYLSRFDYLFDDHTIFSGVTYTEDHYLLPGLTVVALALLIAAAVALANAVALRRMRVLAAAVALPAVVYLFAVVVVPGYVQSFIVKPNELDREAPYIGHNIAATRRAFNLERVEARDFPADTANDAYALEENRTTLDNLRLWDYRALQDTLRQVQEIRTYYDFNDVDIDRYQIGGQTRQVLLAARELDVSKLPESSRGNWINERLIYTHGYGATMNTANGFTPEGRPEFILSNMPTESNAPDVKVTRPQIYFGEKTDTTVYVKTRQKEFDYPQGDANASTTYEGGGGFAVGGFLRRWVLAWETNDLSRLPFADDVTPESRVLMRRTIGERVRTLAPFLTYDADPYVVVNREGRLFWIIDAYTTTETYPFARHHELEGSTVNYIRNSVKVTVDAYDGAVTFYVFDTDDAVLRAYRGVFPTLFRDAAQMPEDLRAHVRYPETLLGAQADVYSLYHTDDAKVFFQREDMWSVARESVAKNNVNSGSGGGESAPKDNSGTEATPLEPYYALLQLPGGGAGETPSTTEFVNVVAFTPASRDNLIGWMAGRSDGGAYGRLLVYKFPKSKLVNGPLQVNARIDQNAQLSSQLTLWNQEGSRVQRGNLLIIPLGRGLLYVQTIYLQAVRSPMPELRLVVLATQDRLAYGTTFADALTGLFGNAAAAVAPAPAANAPAPGDQGSTPTQQASQQTSPPSRTTTELVNRAAQDLADYQRLTAEGKLGEAGQKLESLKRTLDELQKVKQ